MGWYLIDPAEDGNVEIRVWKLGGVLLHKPDYIINPSTPLYIT